jgi:hypothetical protein
MSADSDEVNQRAIELIHSFVPGQVGRRPANLPALTDADGRLLPKYLVEKITGVRRETGSLKLKRLTTRHMKMIGMRLEGLPLEQIAMQMSCTVATASRVLNDPLARNLLQRIYSDREDQLKALAGPATEAVRAALAKDQPMGVRLRGVDRYTKMREVMLPKDAANETAEDVIQRILNSTNFINSNVQINVQPPFNEPK